MKVIDLDAFREIRRRRHGHLTVYLKSSDECLKTLLSFPFLKLHPLQSVSKLGKYLIDGTADLFLIDSNVSWGDPITLIKTIRAFTSSPIIVLGKKETTKKKIKQMFSAGAHDALYFPLKRDDVKEALDVLLKFQTSASKS